MALPQFSPWGVDGGALETRGLTNGNSFDEVSIVIFGLIFPTANIWDKCAVITNTVWNNCATYGATWTLAPTQTTTWTVI